MATVKDLLSSMISKINSKLSVTAMQELTDDQKKIARENLGLLNEGVTIIPQMFGAVGDGETDDTQAFKYFLNYIIENKLEGYIPAGVYIINNQLSYPSSDISLRGAGIDRTILKGPVNDTLFYFSNANSIKISNMTLDGRTTDHTAKGEGVGINIQRSNNVFIDNVKAVKFAVYGIWAISGGDEIIGENIHITNCMAEYCYSGIQIQGCRLSTIKNCVAKNIRFSGVTIKAPAESCTVDNITAENCGNTGFNVGSSFEYAKATNCIMTNIVSKNVSIGMQLANCDRCIIDNIYVKIADEFMTDKGHGFILKNSQYNNVKNAMIENIPDNKGFIQFVSTIGDCIGNTVKFLTCNTEHAASAVSFIYGDYIIQNNIIEFPTSYNTSAHRALPSALPESSNYFGFYGGGVGGNNPYQSNRFTPAENVLQVYNTAVELVSIDTYSQAHTIQTIEGGYIGRRLILAPSSGNNNIDIVGGGNITITQTATVTQDKPITLLYTD